VGESSLTATVPAGPAFESVELANLTHSVQALQNRDANHSCTEGTPCSNIEA
jgi:hypothetical protein